MTIDTRTICHLENKEGGNEKTSTQASIQMLVAEVKTPPQYTEPTWSELVQTAGFGWSEINPSSSAGGSAATHAHSSQEALQSGGSAHG